MEDHLCLANLLEGLVDLGQHLETVKQKKLQCHSSDLTYTDCKKLGKVECCQYYETFKACTI